MDTSTVACVGVTMLSTLIATNWLAIASRIFENLHVYLLATSEDKEVVRTKNKKAYKASNVKQPKASTFPDLSVIKLSRLAPYELLFFSAFDQTMALVLALTCNCAAGMVFHFWFTRNTMLPALCGVTLCIAIYNAANTIFSDKLSSKVEKYTFITMSILGAALAGTLLHFKPEVILSTNLAESTKVSVTFLGDLLKKKLAPELKIEEIVIPEEAIVVMMSLLAGLVTASCVSSAMRNTQAYGIANSTFQWATALLTYPRVALGIWHVSMLLPVIVVLLGIKPLAMLDENDVVSPRTFNLVMLWLIVFTHLFASRIILQAFSNGGLVEWYELKHSTGDVKSLEILAKFTRSALQRKLQMLGKVAVQCATLPLVLVSLIPFMMYPGSSKTDAQYLWEVISSFLSWWACLAWSITFLVSLYFRRLGVVV